MRKEQQEWRGEGGGEEVIFFGEDCHLVYWSSSTHVRELQSVLLACRAVFQIHCDHSDQDPLVPVRTSKHPLTCDAQGVGGAISRRLEYLLL